VSHLGELYPSGFLPASAGNVGDRRLVDLYRESELFQRLRDPDALQGKCGACAYRNVCGGSRSRAHAHTGDPLCAFVPDEYDGPLPDARNDGRSESANAGPALESRLE
jgi:radical SAM protein with 4Fe4S-binding SPASM domain